AKSISLHWEFMFTRARYQTRDMHKQGELLNQVSRLADAGQIQTTLKTDLSPITAPNLRQAHALIESGRSIGKVALAGFEA
ncbi:MAG TPA: zinc-binding alcohol dehydrogenase family protein, partial [Verrucomicrobiales bacterium]|nr:zinc-binding alcohol dehydrogenase family protein [Verrucomicrobiales bacterium]